MTEIILTIMAVILPACPTEDSTWCIWDGRGQGNETGSVVINFSEDHYMTI